LYALESDFPSGALSMAAQLEYDRLMPDIALSTGSWASSSFARAPVNRLK
jgi:hypothetical protein